MDKTLMDNLNLVTDISSAFSFSKMRLLRKICFSCEDRDRDESVSVVEMEMDSEDLTPNIRVCFRFSGVVNFMLNLKDSSTSRIIGFDVRNISERGWEGLKWEVEDYEDQRISFCSATAKVVSAELV